MKQLLLSAIIICGVSSDCLTLDKEDKVAIVAGAATAIGLWSWWGHVSNKNAVKRAEYLWQECHAFIGKQEDCLSKDLQKTLYLLESTPMLKYRFDISSSYKALACKMDWFWNRSCHMKLAYENSVMLKKSLDAYLAIFNATKQQIAAQKVVALWNIISPSDLVYDPSCDSIKSTTKQALSEHALLQNGRIINELYLELYESSSYCYGFADAHAKITTLKRAHDRWLHVLVQIQRYDDFVAKYQDFIASMYQPYHKRDFVSDARRNSSGEYPLLNFVKQINVDIEALLTLKLNVSYIRFSNGGVVSIDNALIRVIQHLQMVSSMVVGSDYYQDELRYYREKLRLLEEQRRLAQEQWRLQANINKVNREIDDLKHETRRLENELKNKQK